MGSCLLCNQEIPQKLTFSALFLLKTPENLLCEKCQSTFEKIPEQHCPRCYKSDVSGLCTDCKNWEKLGIFVNHRAIFRYNAAMKAYFARYKFLGDYRLGQVFAPYFAKLAGNAVLVPLPLSPESLQERGFNQVSAFLEQTKFQELLTKSTSPRQSSLDRHARLASKNTFSIKPEVHLPPKILLIDDIYTTGRTLQHAVETLKTAGVTEISTFSLCR